ncbi:MAG: hypothetical protein J6R85_00980 [Lentisphaeria bacterium]|nr:hypothetical protein [Lentisphaeria bacterium]
MKRFLCWSALALLGLSICAAETKVVRYEDFGAKGDGKTNDHEAIRLAHEYANKNNLPVRANDKATYYIGAMSASAVIQTDTDWGKAKFIVDDTVDFKAFRQPLFRITSRLNQYVPEGITSLKAGQKKLEVTLPVKSLVQVYNSKKKQFIRYGGNANNGSDQRDLFVADKDGTIDQGAPIVWDFDTITSVVAYPIDDTTLTVNGGHFTTLTNHRPGRHIYFGRGIAINRSNTVLQNMRHDVVEPEGLDSWPYTGFINPSNCAYFTAKNCQVTGRKVYGWLQPDGKKRKTTGTYDISGTSAAFLNFINVTQINDNNDTVYWGVMGTNFCKAVTLDGCKVSRFDAHQGVTNAVIRNSVVGHQGINAIGFGTFLIENTKSTTNRLVNFRQDYGATWRGNFIIRNCEIAPVQDSQVNVFMGHCTPDHYFGYDCYMPESILIDGLKITLPKGRNAAIFTNMDMKGKNTPDAPYRYNVVKNLTVNNLSVKGGSNAVLLARDPKFFAETKVSGNAKLKR